MQVTTSGKDEALSVLLNSSCYYLLSSYQNAVTSLALSKAPSRNNSNYAMNRPLKAKGFLDMLTSHVLQTKDLWYTPQEILTSE